jgi:hypothetical protein
MRLARTAFAACFVAALVVMLVDLGAAKPATTSDNWTCAVTFADRSGDMIRSDGRNAYTNGVDRVTCEIYPTGSGGLSGNLHFQPQTRSQRRIRIEGQPGYTAADTAQPDYFEVGRLRSAQVVGATYLRPFRVTKGAASMIFRGDSFASGTSYDGSSSVFVTPLDACSWEVEFNPDAALVTVDASGIIVSAGSTSEGATLPRVLALNQLDRTTTTFLGYFSMPFKARLDIIGNKAGCPVS